MQNCELKIYTAKLLLLAVWANLTMHMCRFFLQHCNNSKLQDFQLFHWNRGRYLSKGPCTSPREGGLNYQTISSLQLASRVPLSQPNQMKRCLTTSNAQRNNMLHPVSNKSCVKGQTENVPFSHFYSSRMSQWSDLCIMQYSNSNEFSSSPKGQMDFHKHFKPFHTVLHCNDSCLA